MKFTSDGLEKVMADRLGEPCRVLYGFVGKTQFRAGLFRVSKIVGDYGFERPKRGSRPEAQALGDTLEDALANLTEALNAERKAM